MWVYREVALSSLLESPSTLGREEELLDQPRLLRDHLQRGQADTFIQGRLVLRDVYRKIKRNIHEDNYILLTLP